MYTLEYILIKYLEKCIQQNDMVLYYMYIYSINIFKNRLHINSNLYNIYYIYTVNFIADSLTPTKS